MAQIFLHNIDPTTEQVEAVKLAVREKGINAEYIGIDPKNQQPGQVFVFGHAKLPLWKRIADRLGITPNGRRETYGFIMNI